MNELREEERPRHFAARLDLNFNFNAPVVLVRYDDVRPRFYDREHREDGAVVTAQNLICWD